ncbi:MAG TPA: hypothetical protein PK043_13830, partial [Alicycliphilus sp.]|nr:hypothetical protein [Alicycliphilus sp.]
MPLENAIDFIGFSRESILRVGRYVKNFDKLQAPPSAPPGPLGMLQNPDRPRNQQKSGVEP